MDANEVYDNRGTVTIGEYDGGMSDERQRPTAHAIEQLLNTLCVKLGFCLPASVNRQLANSGPTNADLFAKAVFKAEGLDPRLHVSLFRQVRAIVADHFRRISDSSAAPPRG
jgi:hypothetical protein